MITTPVDGGVGASSSTEARDLIALEDRFGAHNYHPLDVVLTRAEGCWVWDLDGRRYLDCLAAYSAVNQGHNHPRIVQALVDQAQRLALTSRAFHNDQLGPFCQELAELTGFARVLPMNTGAEAVETALKAVRKWGYKVKGVPDGQAEIITFGGNFAGRTISIISFSDEPQYRDGFGPFTPGFKQLPYGDPQAVADAIGPNTVAVFMEPVQGEAGIVMPPPGTLQAIREICDDHDVLLIFDEIQSGLGRTGKLFAWQHEDARPDGMTLGKALSGGLYPVSAFVADEALMDVFHPGDHGSTFGGNPLGAATARAALRVLIEEGLVENAARMGERFRAGLAGFDFDSIAEIRQTGLWIGIQLHATVGGARRYCEALQQRGMLCKETHEHTIRVAPPLTIQAQQVDWAVEQLRDVFEQLG
ncbi:MAG: ornithine--oxo-acid transaminase [Caldilineae bacterium]|nr:ornithine--oxo-acid transaminase [Chloroflexota bacterium]MCB9176329.1 ornithine--oxo-acid transaminase [Caldilineae bacterium]